jgi:NhaP-type Na+/H+ or K+/H+ antiporter
MSKRKPYRSSKLAQKKRKQRKIKIILWTVLFISIIAGASYWSGHDSVVVSQINISENEFINDQDVLEKASQIISGRHLFLFSKSNFLLIPQSKIEDYSCEMVRY